jgi:L-alanine-DL-glutamate epimerase-like enolase superfamily enzyme
MRVVGVSFDVLEVPLRTGLATASADWTAVRLGLLSLRTDTGLTGLSEAVLDRHATGGAAGAGPGSLGTDLSSALGQALSGIDLADGRIVDEQLRAIDAWPELGPDLRSAVATARVDVLASSGGRSVAAWLVAEALHEPPIRLGGAPAVDVAVNALVGIAEPEVAAAEARRLVDRGYRCLKLKAGAEAPGSILRRVAAVRESVGPSVALRLDLNGTQDEAGATSLLGALAQADLEYVEQPIPATAGMEALARLRRRVAVPIAADEGVTDAGVVRALAAAGAVDVIVVKPARVGGLAEAARIVDLAVAAETRVTVATFVESGLGVAAALHLAALVPGDRAHGLSTAGLLVSDLLADGPVIRDGRMALPPRPGLGVTLDAAAVDRHRVGGGAWDA